MTIYEITATFILHAKLRLIASYKIVYGNRTYVIVIRIITIKKVNKIKKTKRYGSFPE